ncbi:unnamed protein product [Dracunculus medinensis]|uniref:C2H2-type domain-containing protein n=1 Tax=Dracunculus medinensis TaxID=318479 RepID=A0A0N4U9N7_DRAME|nr:unnamed protein product [Dracunculus medinensis]
MNTLAVLNENCCAICGIMFGLTIDLVQHIRTNHRSSRFNQQ